MSCNICCHLRYRKQVTHLRSLESHGNWCYCADNSVACVSVVSLKHCLGVSTIDWCDVCRLESLNAAQDQIKVLLSPLLLVPPPWVQWSNELAREMYIKRALEKLKLEYPDLVSDLDCITLDL